MWDRGNAAQYTVSHSARSWLLSSSRYRRPDYEDHAPRRVPCAAREILSFIRPGTTTWPSSEARREGNADNSPRLRRSSHWLLTYMCVLIYISSCICVYTQTIMPF